jgi:pimeloyl-ACP methyl ester carboxylesterase
LWYGTADDMVPASVGEFLAGKIRNSHLKVYKNEGHLLLFSHWEEILTSLIKD